RNIPVHLRDRAESMDRADRHDQAVGIVAIFATKAQRHEAFEYVPESSRLCVFVAIIWPELRMKIALYNLTTTTKVGGVESVVWDVGQKLAERGHDVTLFGGRGKIDRPGAGLRVRRYPYIARDTWGRVPPLRKSLNLLKLLERLSMAAWAVPDLMAGKFDIVQVVKPYDFPVGAHVRFYGGARMVYNSHGTDFFPGD